MMAAASLALSSWQDAAARSSLGDLVAQNDCGGRSLASIQVQGGLCMSCQPSHKRTLCGVVANSMLRTAANHRFGLILSHLERLMADAEHGWCPHLQHPLWSWRRRSLRS